MTTDILEQRLRRLSVSTPDPGRVSARVLESGAAGWRPAPRRLAAALVAFLALVALVTYFVPALGTVVADIPVAGDLLRDAGIFGVRDRITSVGSSATSSGYRLELVGAYADSSRTVLLVRAPALVSADFSSVTLTDQFGRTYSGQSAAGDLRSGETEMQFEPLAWPVGFTGARITLHVRTVDVFPADLSAPLHVAGAWDLPATLGVDEGSNLAPPAPGALGKARFRFTSVVYTPATLEIQVDEWGMSIDELNRIIPDGGKGTPAFILEVVGPDGSLTSGYGSWSDDSLGVVHISLRVFRAAGPGTYVVTIGYAGLGSFDRTLIVP